MSPSAPLALSLALGLAACAPAPDPELPPPAPIPESEIIEDIALDLADTPPPPSAPPEPAAPPEPTQESPPEPDEVFDVVEQLPELIGGLPGLQARLVYPPSAVQEGVQGRVIVQLIIDQEGRVQNATVIRSPDPRLSDAAVAAVEASAFHPGIHRGQPVKVRYTLPVVFRLP